MWQARGWVSVAFAFASSALICACSMFDGELNAPRVDAGQLPDDAGHVTPDATVPDRDADDPFEEGDAGDEPDAGGDAAIVDLDCDTSADCALPHAEGFCADGTCVIAECTGRYRDCDQNAASGCEASMDDVRTCGGCNIRCDIDRAIEGCENGVCVPIGCEPGYDDCDGSGDTVCETQVQSALRCGGCDDVCEIDHAVPECADLECVMARCETGYDDCDDNPGNGCEERLDTLARCGSCDTPCALAACSGGVCSAIACTAPDADCNGDGVDCEVDLSTDAEHCGACNSPCELAANAQHASGVTCAGVTCKPTCDASFADCDPDYKNGCETPTNTVQNCGACNSDCDVLLANTAAASCGAGGVCTIAACDPGFDDCDGMDSTGCEASLTSVNNCGGCASTGDNEPCTGLPNVASSTCDTGSCEIETCAGSAADCDGSASNGCEVGSEPDADSDGARDCRDECPSNALSATASNGCGLGYVPANVDVKPLNPAAADATTTINCAAVLSTSGTPSFTTWCGGTQPPIVVQAAGDLAVIAFRNLSIPSGGSLRIQGTRPAVLVVFGTATIAGTIDAGASSSAPGAGGNLSCGTSQGANGTGSTERFDGATGGGGGGFGTAGGRSGRADTDGSNLNGAAGGVVRPNTTTLVPLVGGCAGGRAGDCATDGGHGGGALQLVVSGTLTVSGTIRNNGGNGATPCGANDEGGGTGGGSGGAIRLEASSLNTSGSTIQARGGNGGGNGTYDGIFNCGGAAGANGSTSPSNPGSNGGDCQGGSVGGGGGYGRVVTCNRATGSGC